MNVSFNFIFCTYMYSGSSFIATFFMCLVIWAVAVEMQCFIVSEHKMNETDIDFLNVTFVNCGTYKNI